jgi:biotin synthase
MTPLVSELREKRTLAQEGLRELLESKDASLVETLHRNAREVAVERFGKQVWLRALIEWSNVCRRDCLYCGIRKSNRSVTRYTLSREDILGACESAWKEGVRTFVLQGGENPSAALSLIPVVAEIRSTWQEAAITLSLGELPFETYALLRKSGADRYLLRQETASAAHYSQLHPSEMQLESRLKCLEELHRLGFQTGMGMMVGSPGQTVENLLEDIRLIERFRPEMVGIGPFIPHPETPLGQYPAGSAALTLRIYSILRLMLPDTLIPSTTALSTLSPGGRMDGILAGANVIMPNFTPRAYRQAYSLYQGKPDTDGAEALRELREELSAAGYTVNPGRGDYKKTS